MESVPNVFKTAIAVVTEPQATPTTYGEQYKVSEQSSIPPSLYVEANKAPLVSEELGLSQYLDKFDTRELSTEVNDFILSEITRLHLKDDTDTYKSLLNDYSRKVGVEGLDDPFIKLEKINQYIKVQSKLLEAKSEYDDLMKADISEVKYNKLEKWLKIHGVKSV